MRTASITASLSLATLCAHASLGEIQREARAPRDGNYASVQKVLPSGTKLVEVIDRQRTVVAVAWSGPFMPELRTLLGRHYPALVDAQARSSLHAPLVVRTSEVAIVSGGTVGAFSGRAWLPGRAPANIQGRELP